MNIPIAILCGGRGKRLKPLTDELPKPLIPLRNKPILEHILNFYKSKGFSDFIFCIGYKGEKIVHFVDNYKRNNSQNFTFSDMGVDANILKRIYALKDFFSDRIFCTYGDTLTDLEMEEIFKSHQNQKSLATIITSKIKNPFGLIEINQLNKVTNFTEKPIFNYYIGHFIMEKRAMDYIDNEMLDMPDGQGLITFFQKLIEKQELGAFEHHGAQITFNTEIERVYAEKDIIDFYSQKEEN